MEQSLTSLVTRSRAGDRQAFGSLAALHGRWAFAFALTFVNTREDAEDIVQDALVTAYCKIGQLRDPEQFGAWLRTILRSVALERVRRSRIVQFASDTTQSVQKEVDSKTVRECEATARNTELHDLVGMLSPENRETVLLYYVGDISYAQISRLTGASETTIRGRLHRCRRQLRNLLECADKEKRAMNTQKVQEEVENAICFVHNEAIDERIPVGNAKALAIFLGVPGNVEICGTEGDAVIVTGTKTSLGFTEEEAKLSTGTIRFLCDQVESYLEKGPHGADVFSGTSSDGKGGKPVGQSSAMTEEHWKQQWASESDSNRDAAFFPTTETERELRRLLRDSFDKPTMRLSVVREKMEDIAIPPEAFTSAIRRALAPNSTETGYVHGPRGVANIVVAIPAGLEITLLGDCRDVHVWGLKATVNLVGQRGDVRIENVEGDVRLKSTSPNLLKGVTGNVLWHDYDGGGVEWSNRVARRHFPEGTVENVTGTLWIDTGKLNLDVSGVRGTANVRNCYGTTRYRVAEHREKRTHRIESEAGEVKLFLKDGLWNELALTLATRWGTIDHSILDGLTFTACGNDPQRTFVSTAQQSAWTTALADLEADIVVVTKSGDITLEKTK
jgi:RNA polymerase sigma-70 factor (ECF subfamily)